jgi:predicted flap endonuclease-1-like 5' DNA nuclease
MLTEHMTVIDHESRLGVRHNLPISKLYGVLPTVRFSLKKIHRITTCAQLLLAAGDTTARAALLKTTGIDEDVLLRLVQRADMARIRGIGVVFGLMLEELGIVDIEQLARQKPAKLHAALQTHNLKEKIARRAPTMEEVVEWIEAARTLPIIVTYEEPSVSGR